MRRSERGAGAEHKGGMSAGRIRGEELAKRMPG